MRKKPCGPEWDCSRDGHENYACTPSEELRALKAENEQRIADAAYDLNLITRELNRRTA